LVFTDFIFTTIFLWSGMIQATRVEDE